MTQDTQSLIWGVRYQWVTMNNCAVPATRMARPHARARRISLRVLTAMSVAFEQISSADGHTKVLSGVPIPESIDQETSRNV